MGLARRDTDGFPVYGEPTLANMFEGKSIQVVGLEAEAMRFVLQAFSQDGAVVIDGRSGMFVAASFLIGDIRRGVNGGGARHKSASAVAQQAGMCYLIKCSNDACSRGKAEFDLFYG